MLGRLVFAMPAPVELLDSGQVSDEVAIQVSVDNISLLVKETLSLSDNKVPGLNHPSQRHRSGTPQSSRAAGPRPACPPPRARCRPDSARQRRGDTAAAAVARPSCQAAPPRDPRPARPRPGCSPAAG